MAFWYLCKDCGAPVFVAIEGELICPDCWNMRQLDFDEAQADRQIAEYMRWAETHCEGCGEPFPGGGCCPECQAERDEIAAELWPAEDDDIYDEFDRADWGDGSISPDEELRRAALDHRGQP